MKMSLFFFIKYQEGLPGAWARRASRPYHEIVNRWHLTRNHYSEYQPLAVMNPRNSLRLAHETSSGLRLGCPLFRFKNQVLNVNIYFLSCLVVFMIPKIWSLLDT